MSDVTQPQETDLAILLKQQEELTKRIAELQEIERQSEIERKKREAEEKGLVITITNFYQGYLTVEASYNYELMQIWRHIPTRRYSGQNANTFHAKDLDTFNAQLSKLSFKHTLEWKEGVKEQVDKWLATPAFSISKTYREFRIVIGNNAYAPGFNVLPGIKWESKLGAWTLPLTEGWRLLDCLKDTKPQYTPEAIEYIEQQIADRNRLQDIAKLEDIKYDPWFKNGHRLKPFQKVGAAFIEAAGGNALNGDQTGLGKTWQAIAYAWKNKFTTVIICPAKLKSNWFREIQALTGETATILQGTSPTDDDIIKLLVGKPKFVIINYDILSRVFHKETITKDEEGYLHKKETDEWLWVDLINMFGPDLIIYDEGHYMQNHDSQRSQAGRMLKAPRRLIMTATPMLNTPANLWPILTIIDPELFPSQTAFLDRYTIDGKRPRNIEELSELLKSKMIRRLKKDVQKDLPEIIPVKDFETLSPKAKKLYQRVLEGVYQVVSEWNPHEAGSEKKVTNILVQIMRLKQICAISKIDSTADRAVELFDNAEGNDNRKVIIFSQFVPIVHAIAKRLGQEAIVITGETPVSKRMELVDTFQNDDSIHFAVCSSKAVSEGLTMTKAGSIIFHDLLWTPYAHEQLVGRAYGRLNDAHGVDVRYAVIEDSIEEWILDLLNEKQAMGDAIVDGMGEDSTTSVAMALIQKIKRSL